VDGSHKCRFVEGIADFDALVRLHQTRQHLVVYLLVEEEAPYWSASALQNRYNYKQRHKHMQRQRAGMDIGRQVRHRS
jgi:hypothetical protein